MKFFSINNKLCAKCANCGKIYIVNASENKNNNLNISDELTFNNNSDGVIEINLPNESSEIEKYKKENLELEQKLSAILEENRLLKERNFLLEQEFKVIINRIPYGIVIFNNNQRITFANDAFIELQGYKAKSLANTHIHLEGVKIKDILCNNAFAYIESSLYSEDVNINKTICTETRKLSLSTYPIKKADLAFAIFKDIYNKEVVKEDISIRIQEVLDQNMAMIQKIGFLMGEETSKTTKTLNSIISTLKNEEK
ncbi:MAG: PAS domain-containing protein [Rikenellaceae bacterium]